MAPTFKARLFRYHGPSGWTFVTVPKKHAPPVTAGWGHTPVVATVDGYTWNTSVWWDTKTQSTLLAVPKKVRGERGHGEMVFVRVEFDAKRT